MKKAIHKQDQTFKQQQQQLPDANRNTKVKLLGIWIERERERERSRTGEGLRGTGIPDSGSMGKTAKPVRSMRVFELVRCGAQNESFKCHSFPNFSLPS
jgi:hypothetical protein